MIILEWFLLKISTPINLPIFLEKQIGRKFFVLSGLELCLLFSTVSGLAAALLLLLMGPL